MLIEENHVSCYEAPAMFEILLEVETGCSCSCGAGNGSGAGR